MPVDHDERIALVCRHLKGRSQTRAGRDLYDASIVREGNDPSSCVAQAARGVLALYDAGAISGDRAAVALATLTTAFQATRPLGGPGPR